MKQIIVIFLLAVGSVSVATSAKAQVSISVNIGSQPAWGPAGYDYAEYYYLPDLDIYYNIPLHRFYYLSGNRWIYSTALPAKYRNFDLYSTHKVVLKDKNAYLHHTEHLQQYAQFRNKRDQQPIRDSRDQQYSQNKNNWQNNQFRDVQQQPAARPQAASRQQPVARQQEMSKQPSGSRQQEASKQRAATKKQEGSGRNKHSTREEH